MRTCNKCGEARPLEDYYAHRRSECKECCKATSAKWRLEHPETHKASVVEWCKAHPERARAINRVSVAKWGKAHPEVAKAKNHKRRVAKLAYQGPHHTAADIAALLIDQHDLCAHCGIVLNGKYHVDHVVPLSQGGGNGADNIALACPPCNLSKGDKSLLIWAIALGRERRWQ